MKACWSCRWRRSRAHCAPSCADRPARVASDRSARASGGSWPLRRLQAVSATVNSRMPRLLSVRPESAKAWLQCTKRACRLARAPGHSSGARLSTRNCSSSSNTSRSTGSPGRWRACRPASLRRRRRLAPSSRPRWSANRAGTSDWWAAASTTGAVPRYSVCPLHCSEASPAMARNSAPPQASMRASEGVASAGMGGLVAQRQFLAEAALEILGHDGPLGRLALVEEGQLEGQPQVVEDLRVLGPGDDGARRHQQ